MMTDQKGDNTSVARTWHMKNTFKSKTTKNSYKRTCRDQGLDLVPVVPILKKWAGPWTEGALRHSGPG